jgi:hypothetical protein
MVMNCKFVVGQKVVCTFQGEWGVYPGEKITRMPVFGEVCEIVSIEVYHYDPNQVGLKLIGFDPIDVFNHLCFEPVHEKKTDISIFQEMLTKTPATIDA